MAPGFSGHEAENLAGNPTSTLKRNVQGSSVKTPLIPTGVLDAYESFDVTPAIGREYPHANLVDWITSPNADELLTELAYIVSSRGVVFFRKQDDLTTALQKQLIHRLGQLAGKPSTSGLHIHPIVDPEDVAETGPKTDLEITTIHSSEMSKVYGLQADSDRCRKKQSSDAWHSDVSFEPVPSDYTSLRLTQLPSSGGDTLWASGYEIYDCISPPLQKMLESLTCTFHRRDFNNAAANCGTLVYDKPRGSPLNVGTVLRAVHPVIRTNPVTGWRSMFAIGQHLSHINGVTAEESTLLVSWLKSLLKDNHDLQVRFRWHNENDIAIWDNRSTFHNATFDVEGQGLGDRSGVRASGVGEQPFFDPTSVSRQEALRNQRGHR